MAAPTWPNAKSSALSILGKEAKIPDPTTALQFQEAFKKEYATYTTMVKGLQDKILKLQNAASSVRNAMKQYEDALDRSNFGLDDDDAAVKPKIAKAQGVLDKFLDETMKRYDDGIKALDELDKHTMALMTYKSPAA